MNNPKVCYVKKFASPRDNKTFRAVALKGSYWTPGETIDVYFMGGTSIEKTRMIEVFSEIESFANIKFNVTSIRNNSDVRISFVKGAGSWSYLGSQALFISKSTATMNIGWDDLDKSTSRHECGHMLNLYHEHQNPLAAINYDRQAIIEDLTGPPNYWTISQIQHNIFDVLDAAKTDNTDFDPDSVMLYFFPPHWTTDGKGTKQNKTWSQTDIDFLRAKYPFPDVVEPNPVDKMAIYREAIEELVSDRKELDRFKEVDLIKIASWYDIPATKDDLKADTADAIWNKIVN